MILALFALRGRAAFPSTRDPLVRQGPHAHARHPIHSGLLLALFALVLISPTRATLLACLIAVVWIVIQSRLEEIDLCSGCRRIAQTCGRFPVSFPAWIAGRWALNAGIEWPGGKRAVVTAPAGRPAMSYTLVSPRQ